MRLPGLRFPGRDLIFMILLSTLMLPFTVLMIPRYIQFRELGWLDTWKPLIVPNWFGGSVFFIFLLRQFFRTIPRDLSDAAKLDGASEFRIYWQIVLPLVEACPGRRRRLCLSRHLERLPGAVDLHHVAGEVHRVARACPTSWATTPPNTPISWRHRP